MDLPIADGFQDRAGQLWRPAAFAPPERGVDPRLLAVDAAGMLASLHLTSVPDMATYWDRDRHEQAPELFALLHDRRGNIQQPERHWHILSIASEATGRLAEVRHGTHPDHPDETGFYVGAALLGTVSLGFSDVSYLPTEQVDTMHFPFPRIQR